MAAKQYETISFTRQIKQQMIEIARSKAILKISETGYESNSPIIAKVVGINEDKGILGISSFRDRKDNTHQLKGNRFFVVTIVQGVTYKFVASLTQTQTCNGVNFVRFPEELQYLQRREHYRVPVPEGCAELTMDLGGVTAFKGCIKDISVSGMRVFASNKETLDLDVGSKISRCLLKLDSSEAIRFSAELRYTQQNDDGALFMGLAIKEMENTHRSLIERYVADRDRELRRKAIGL